MEEILASIRRIISDEVAAEPAPVSPLRAAEASFAREAPLSAGKEGASAPLSERAPLSASPRSEPARRESLFSRGPAHVEATRTDTSRSADAAASRMAVQPLSSVRARAVANGGAETSFSTTSAYSHRAVAAVSQPQPSGADFAPAGRLPASNPFAPRARSAAAFASMPVDPVLDIAVSEASGLHEEIVADDLSAPLTAALLDLATVEQAVQAELANVSLVSNASRPQNLDAAPSDAKPSVERSDIVQVISPAASVDAGLVSETDDMQPQVKSEQAGPRTEGDVDSAAAVARESVVAPRVAVAQPRSESRFATIARAAGQGAEVTQPEARERLVSGVTDNAVTAAFGSLHRSVTSNSRTVDDLVAEALRPMLKEWLDQNLPSLVERLVRAEIERVARQGQ